MKMASMPPSMDSTHLHALPSIFSIKIKNNQQSQHPVYICAFSVYICALNELTGVIKYTILLLIYSRTKGAYILIAAEAISIGHAFGNGSNALELVSRAEKDMYSDKRSYYIRHGLDRRRT